MDGTRLVRTFSHFAITGWTAIVLLTSSPSFAAPYRLAAGDTVEVSIGGATEQRHRAQIQIDGTIALPGIGTVEVAGLTTAELQRRMETLLQSRVLRQRLPDGREQAIIVVPGDVIASV